MRLTLLSAALLLAFAGNATNLLAKASEADLARLDKDLTPVGAERAGNKEGTIPAWTGGLDKPPANWNREQQGYIDPFPDDKPLFTITNKNLAQYKDKLGAGQLGMFARYPEFRMPIYQSRRTAKYPAGVLKQARAQATQVELNGFGLKNLGGSTIPFPLPQNGLEVIWNHLVRYLGGGVEGTSYSFPVRANGDYYKIGFHAMRIFDQNMDVQTPNRLFQAMGYFTEPVTLKGTTFLVHEPVDQVAERRSAWIYLAGARRVRRAPDLGYDGVNDGSEGMVVTDQVDGYNGAPDRYDWKIIGKRELYVPYNAYRVADKALKYSDLIRPGFINPDYMRYELHRMWVVEANLKAGMSHVYARRTFYIDEDSWTVMMEDTYATRGNLWRVSILGLIQYYDVDFPWYVFGAVHDLDSGGYILAGLKNEVRGEVIKFGVKGRVADFQPDALRRLGGTR